MAVLGSLTNRIFLASALLAALSIGAALFFVRARLTTETQEALDRDLQTAANIVDQQQQALFENFTTSARLLADLPRFKAAVDTGHGPTVQPIAEATEPGVVDPRRHVLLPSEWSWTTRISASRR